ncbi:MAG: enoyl-CoA hydratase/isomerase family protein [Conexivisphaera sp.]
MSLSFTKIIYEKRDGVAWITLNNPERYNALEKSMRAELKAALEDAWRDDSVRAVVIRGSGKAFSAGGDIKAMLEWTPTVAMRELKELGTAFVIERIIRDMPKPVIAMVHGYCLGGGFELAMACDLVVASSDAKFGSPEIGIGLIPGSGGTQMLPRHVGEKKAKELIFTGDQISAEEAARLGLVNRVVPPDGLQGAVEELLAKLKSKSPVALAAAKEAINASLELGLTQGIRYEAQVFSQLFSTEDQKEGARAFLEKRKPEWRGR